MSLLNSYTGFGNFWKENPQLLIPEVFKKLYDADKSKDKEESSRIMYGIAFLLDPTEDNKFKNIPEEDRKKLIAKDYIKISNFTWETFEEEIHFYKYMILTQAQRSLYEYEKQMYERDTYLASKPWTLEDGEKKDKMMANTNNLYKRLNEIKEMVNKEEIKSKDRGGQKPTASDLGSM